MFKKIVRYFLGAKEPERESSTQDNGINFNRKDNVLEGDLSVVTIENLMQLMSHAGLSGELRLITTQNAACFIIDQGTLMFCYLKSNPSRIGERLLRKEYITTENLKKCLESYRNKSRKSKFGALLVEEGFLNKQDLEETIKEQVRDIFFEVLSWKKGAFSFSTSESTSNEDIQLEERIDHLIFAGVVQADNEQ